jgi:hypothetical protein
MPMTLVRRTYARQPWRRRNDCARDAEADQRGPERLVQADPTPSMLRPPPRAIVRRVDIRQIRSMSYSASSSTATSGHVMTPPVRRRAALQCRMTTGAFNGSICGPHFATIFVGYEIVKWKRA